MPVRFIFLGTVAMLLLVLGIIIFVILYQRKVIRHQIEIKKINEQKQQELLEASIQGEEEERMRIASELHDDVGATLSCIRLFLHAAAKTSTDPEILEQSKELLDESIRKIRGISHKLQPSTLQYLGLQSSLQSYASLISQSGNMRMQYDCPRELPAMGEHISLSVYRIVQELTNNIIKHAGASAIYLETLIQGPNMLLVLSHNGEGLTEQSFQELTYKKGAIGLKNIVNRIQSIHASIHFARLEEKMYRVVVLVPVNK